MFENVFARGFLTAPPRCDRRQFQFLTENVFAQTGQEWKEGGALHNATTERIRDGHVSGAQDFNESGHAENGIVAQFERITEIVVHTAQNHINRLKAIESF